MLFAYLAVINMVGMLFMYVDKKRAIKKEWRIKEKTLFSIALIGGSVGILFGSYTFHHKTKHLSFKYGIPAIIMLQLVILSAIIYMFHSK